MVFFIFSPLIYYGEFIKYYWSIYNSLLNVFSTYVWFLLIVNTVRYAVYLAIYHLCLFLFSTTALRDFKKKLKNKIKLEGVNKKTAEKLSLLHEMFVFYLNEAVDFNRGAVQRFMTIFLCVGGTFCLVTFVSMFKQRYSLALFIWLIIIQFVFMIITTITIFNLISHSDSLICSSNLVAQSMCHLPKFRIPLYSLLKISNFLEIIYNRKPFRFSFGTLSKITRRSWLSFMFLYTLGQMTLAAKYL